ncbi:MAG: ATP-binding cassette domain-containing protein [Deltaproteobacteria bacterium]|nr:MAG: ATP-binding cassette domain-containing protein [Deltaproteobacteria bacterium]
MPMPAIQVHDLRKSYGDLQALKGISFEISEGEVVGFLGPNGAGKSTAMKILTGFIAPTGGSASIQGHDVLLDSLEARRNLGYLPEHAPLYTDMRVGDYLDFVGRIRGFGPAERAAARHRVAEQCGVLPRLGQRIGELSKGYRQRVGLAQALLHSPPILILDEPTTGLDPNQIVEIRNLIRELGRRRTVLLSTHILSEVQATCDRVIIVHQGRIVADGATAEVTTHEQGGLLVHATFAAGSVALGRDAIRRAITAIDGVRQVRDLEAEQPQWHAFEVLAGRDVRQDLFSLARDRGLSLVELGREKTNLEEVFRRLTGS